MQPHTSVRVGTGIEIGKVTVDINRISGEGGTYSPVLNFPITTEITEKSFAITDLSCLVLLQGENLPNLQIGQVNLINGMGLKEYNELRIPLNQSLVCAIEKYRHKNQNKDVTLILKMKSKIVGIYWTENSMLEPVPSEEKHFHQGYGMDSKVVNFWTTSVEDLKITIPQSIWVKKLLPQIGNSRLRLIEIEIPEKGTYFGVIDADKIVKLFDEATNYYNIGLYRDCIARCRDIREVIEGATKATCNNTLSSIIGKEIGWEKNDIRASFIDNYWTALINITNNASHFREISFSVSDARTCLLSISVLLDYFSRLTDSINTKNALCQGSV